MVDELIEMYRAGAITGYQVMMDCLHLLAEAHPDNEGNFHWQAWDYADELVARMRGEARW